MSDQRIRRERMVARLLEPHGIHDPRVLQAMREIPRHRFVDEALAANAYGDHALPVGHGQTISQPWIVAYMTQLVRAGVNGIVSPSREARAEAAARGLHVVETRECCVFD